MNMQIAETHELAAATPEQTLDIRPLADAELHDVNGGFIWIAIGLAACFEVGMAGGLVLHRIMRE